MMKTIQTDRRTSLHTNTLSDLLEIEVEGLLLHIHLTELSNSCRMTAKQGELTNILEKSTDYARPTPQVHSFLEDVVYCNGNEQKSNL